MKFLLTLIVSSIAFANHDCSINTVYKMDRDCDQGGCSSYYEKYYQIFYMEELDCDQGGCTYKRKEICTEKPASIYNADRLAKDCECTYITSRY